jgi:hypothetical protein
MSTEVPNPTQQQGGNNGAEDKGVKAAVIGAIATILVGILAYLGVTHKSEPPGPETQTFTFSGIVTYEDGKGVPNARVNVTEDQNTPQTILTDEYGHFHVQLSHKTQSLSMRVDAGPGYEVASIDANPHRTGPELISVHKAKAQASKGELVKAITEFEQRLSDAEEYQAQLAPLANKPLDSRQGYSILTWRVWFGDTAYQTAEPEYKNVRWKGVLAKIRELGITEKYSAADKVLTEIEEGDIDGVHYTAEYLEPRLRVLRDDKDTVLEPAIR